MIEAQWELVWERDYRNSAPGTTYRMQVPGGWLYRVTSKGNDYRHTPDVHALCFVPDPKAPHVTGIGVEVPSEPDPDRQPLPRTPPEPFDPAAHGLYRGGKP